MIPAEVLQKIKKLEIKTRQIVNATFTGEYHSVFKGRGINFAEVREYQDGDEVKLIDWNVTAKMGTPFVKVFEEERELTVILAVDLSASGNFGSGEQSKAEIAAEIAAIFGFSANNNNDKVGLLLFSDEIERFIPPKKGKSHIFRLLREIFYFEPKSKKTSISKALDYLMKTNKKKAIVFFISDFIDNGYEKQMRCVARKHDLVPVIIEDPREIDLPKSGLMLLEDEETGDTMYLNTRSKDVREKFKNIKLARKLSQERFFKSVNITPIRVECGKSYTNELVRYFKNRAKRY
jgi:uncharacterized protein (DUF58 family)